MTIEVVCKAARCSNLFIKKGRGEFCSNACKMAHCRSTGSGSAERRDNAEAYETARELASTYYSLPDNEGRNLFLQEVITTATHSRRYRQAITNPHLIVKCDSRRKFMKGAPKSHLTIAELANNYAMATFRKPVHLLVKQDFSFANLTHIDMGRIDLRFSYRHQDVDPISEGTIERQMKGRPAWLIAYYKSIIAAGPASGKWPSDMKEAA